MTSVCHMDLTKYPFDEHTCSLRLQSCKYYLVVFTMKYILNIDSATILVSEMSYLYDIVIM